MAMFVQFSRQAIPRSACLTAAAPPTHITGFYLIDALIAVDFETFLAAAKQLVLPAITLALFVLALAPFWTSSLTRSVAWTFPLMGREGALNQLLSKIGLSSIDDPLIEPLSETSVTLAMIQLYILFMITPLFFTLSQVDRTAIEAARDLGGNWWSTFREVILPQTMPGIVIGSIFAGWATPTESGAVGVLGSMLIAGLNRRLTMTMMNEAIVSACRSNGLVFLIFLGATGFSYVFRVLGGDDLML
jgi:ABC-type Fe3+ transport system permease subunit